MKTKIVYAVVSDETDIFLEQALLSIFSLKKYNTNAFVELVIDQETNESIIGKTKSGKAFLSISTTVKRPKELSIL